MPKEADDLAIAIYASSELSDKTKQNYRDYFSALNTRSNGVALSDVATNPSKYIPLFKKWFEKDTTLKVYISAIQGVFRYNPKFKETHMAHYNMWAEAFKAVKEKVDERYENNKPTERQEAGYVPLEDLIKARDKLEGNDIRRLLLGMYTHLRPLRCEYARVRIYRSKVPDNNKEANYIVLKGKTKANLVIGFFKTRKHHDPFDIDMPAALVEDLHKSLESDPREWLFVDSRGQPYTSALYTKWTMRVFQGIFERPLTVALIRHAYVNVIDFNTLSIKDKKEIATSMGHTVETQDRYRLLFDDAKSQCTCNCEVKQKKKKASSV